MIPIVITIPLSSWKALAASFIFEAWRWLKFQWMMIANEGEWSYSKELVRRTTTPLVKSRPFELIIEDACLSALERFCIVWILKKNVWIRLLCHFVRVPAQERKGETSDILRGLETAKVHDSLEWVGFGYVCWKYLYACAHYWWWAMELEIVSLFARRQRISRMQHSSDQ